MPIRWARSDQMTGDYMICMGMCMNGVEIGMARMRAGHKWIQWVRRQVRPAFFGVAHSTTMPSMRDRGIATKARRPTACATSAFVC